MSFTEEKHAARQRPGPSGVAPPPRGLVEKTAAWSMTHRKTTLVLWIVLVILAYAASTVTGVREQEDADGLTGQSAVAERMLDRADFADDGIERVMIQARSGKLSSATADDVVTALHERYEALDAVTELGEPVTSQDGRSVLFLVTLDLGSGDDKKKPKSVVGPMLEETEAEQRAHPELRIEQLGKGSVTKELSKQLGADFQRAEFISVPVTLLILLVAFGALLAAGLPVLLGITSVVFALGLAGVTSLLVPVDANQASLILLMGLAVGVDYSLFYIRRQREERARGNSPDAALRIAAATSGRAVMVSGLTVAFAMAGMFLSGNMLFYSLALGTILVVLVAVLGSLTVLPAALAGLGDRIDRPRIPLLRRRTVVREESRLWATVLRPVLRAPAVSLVIGVVAMLALAAPALGMKLKMPGDEDLPRSYEIMQTYDRVVEAFPTEGTAHAVAVEADTDRSGEVARLLTELHESAMATGQFAESSKPDLALSKDGRVSRLELHVQGDAGGPEAERTLKLLRTDLAPKALDEAGVDRWAVGGVTAFSTDFSDTLKDRLPLVIGFVTLLCLAVMLLAFRSLLLALLTAALNVLSVAAAYGVLVLVFQGEWAEGLLGFDSNGAVVSWLPLILFVVLYGLSMDYHVFVLSRVREGVKRGDSTHAAVRHGILTSAGVVTTAAVIMVAVFAVFATLSTLDMKQLGVGLAVAILLDATLIRGVLLPAALALLGTKAWPKSQVSRQGPTVSHE
ncbi:MMPL family transporter [Streptomyces caniscabiei]|uniref:MMPL family transporter n=1 Tax=Streptomyces caniscabiei TaxID=2746961 RepID=UPI0029B14247|nr:MMPL family transporter [Streptomyces caniscabiei]MDX2599660.1 MMPL family transporter [Streptomyces caniscabiei]MDX2735045.1 MMPL family transporter [Streptomyces caniscabiei]MDX2776741.1 MMPL family transporter [Streptomyces caniscabiei]